MNPGGIDGHGGLNIEAGTRRYAAQPRSAGLRVGRIGDSAAMIDHSPLNWSPSVTSPPDGVPPAPSVVTRAQVLPFGELTWENFERLCRRLVSFEGDVEHRARYGRQAKT